MKKGKSVKLKLFTPIKSSYGTVDSKNLKSLYINIQSWVTPKYDTDNWNRVVGILSREIKHSVFSSINTEYFREQSIVDLDLRTSGIASGKKSFFNLKRQPGPLRRSSFPELGTWIRSSFGHPGR